MMVHERGAVRVGIFASLLILAGCGDEGVPKENPAKIQVEAVFPATAGATPITEYYEATLAEGIDFRKPGYPTFLVEVAGVSGYESWGRWTDAGLNPSAKFRFKQTLPKKFNLVITAGAFGPNSGEKVKVRAGNVEKTFVATVEATAHVITFETDGKADTLEFFPSKPTSPQEINPNNGDGRKLGIGFVSLKVEE